VHIYKYTQRILLKLFKQNASTPNVDVHNNKSKNIAIDQVESTATGIVVYTKLPTIIYGSNQLKILLDTPLKLYM